jgi:hypothetical protein
VFRQGDKIQLLIDTRKVGHGARRREGWLVSDLETLASWVVD